MSNSGLLREIYSSVTMKRYHIGDTTHEILELLGLSIILKLQEPGTSDSVDEYGYETIFSVVKFKSVDDAFNFLSCPNCREILHLNKSDIQLECHTKGCGTVRNLEDEPNLRVHVN